MHNHWGSSPINLSILRAQHMKLLIDLNPESLENDITVPGIFPELNQPHIF